MKICMVSTYPPKECGIGIYAKNLVEPLLGKGISVEVISFQGYDYKESYVKPLLRKNGLLSYFKTALYIGKNKFDRILIQHEYTFYNVFYFQIFLFLVWLMRKKVNVTMHTIPPYTDYIKKNIFKLINTFILLFANQIIVHTEYARSRLEKNSWIKGAIKVIPIPINPKKTKSFILNKKKVNILCFGFITYDKGLDIACKALGGIRNIQLNIIGAVHPSAMKKQYRYLEQIKSYAEMYPNIKFINKFIPEHKKADVFMKNNFILLPYRFIVQSAVLTEAWSFHKIPICSDIPPFKEEIDNRYGILFKNDNHDDLKKKVLELVNDRNAQQRILNNIIKINKERSISYISEWYLSVLV